jgi:CubicO group peptidase (beta-lactamase class C family)
MKRWAASLAAALALPSAAAVAQFAAGETYDLTVRRTADQVLGGGVKAGQTSAAVALLVRDGKVRFARGYGVEDPATGTAVDPNATRWDVASITKVFTGLEIARLKDQGRIRAYDDPANLYLKTIRLPAWKGTPVTIRQLFTHTAGLDEAAFNVERPRFVAGRFSAAAMQAMTPPLFRRPGDFPAYSNFGFAALGVLVADVQGIDYVDGVQRDLLRPLGMASSGFVTDGIAPPHLLHGYIPRTGERLADDYTLIESAPSGGLFATAADMGRLMIALLGPDPSGAITPRMRRDVFAVQQANRGETAMHGVTFDIQTIGSRRIILKGGALDPIRCWVAFSLEHNSGLFYCHTTWNYRIHHGANRPISYVGTARTLLGALLSPDDPRTLAPPPGGRAAWSPGWETYLGDYVSMRREHFGFGRLIVALQEGVIPVTRGPSGLMIGDEEPARARAPGVFATDSQIVAFTPDPAGPGMAMTTSIADSAFERVGGLDDPSVARPVLATWLVLGLSGLLYPLWAAPGRRRAVGVAGGGLLAIAVGAPVALLLASDALNFPYVWGVAWPIRAAQVMAALVLPAGLCLAAALADARGARDFGARKDGARVWGGRAHLVLLLFTAVGALATLCDLGMFSAYLN